MKILRYLSIVLLLLCALGCKKSDSSGGNKCANVTALSISQQSDAVSYNISAAGASSFEMSYQPGANAKDPSAGTILTLSASSGMKRISDLQLQTQTYTFFVRAICADGTGDWSSPVNVVITDYCGRPYDIRTTNLFGSVGIIWSHDNSPDMYEIQYGAAGFSLGSGTMKTLTDALLDDAAMSAGSSYDFYVRSKCGSNLGWSAWAGPFTYKATSTQNMCLSPSNVAYTVVRNGSGNAVGANFTWDRNGEMYFECTAVLKNENVSSGAIQTVDFAHTPTLLVTQKTDYHFYVRAICSGGNRTAWVGPLLFNIGQ